MCGVAAAFAYSGSADPVDRAELRAVRDHMAARGPDGTGEWFSADGRVGLGHRRLSIIDLTEGGAQPMRSADGSLTISFNGEIYNYRELRAELLAAGRTFRSDSDTEVLLELYALHGTRMLEKLRGMFAFALWDGRRRAMLLARDAFGIKPLYYADDGRTLRAASQVKALLQADVDRRPEPAGHAGYFLWGSVPAPWTLYRGIRCLQPGHFMWAGENGVQPPQPYCLVADILRDASAHPATGTEEDARDAIAAALRDSVRAHLVSDVPVGIFLSAGLDSSMLASLATAAGASPRTLTLAFAEYAGSAHDEAPMARDIAGQLGARHTEVSVERQDFQAERERLLAAMDQPSIDGVNTWFVARAAASQGMKVALSGLGGDELLGSYPSFRQTPLLARLAAPFARVPAFGRFVRTLSDPLVRRLTSPKYAGLLEYGGTLGGAYLLRRGLFMPWELPQVMDPDMARDGWRDLQQLARLDGDAAQFHGAGRSRLAVSALEMSWYMRHQLLCDADWAGMAHSLEIRVPFVDVELLRAAAPWIAAHPQVSKRQVAQSAAPGLSRDVLQRPKTGFLVPVREWLGAPGHAARGLRGWARYTYGASARPARAAGCGRSARVPRVLVSTIAPGPGGVSAMTSFVIRHLAARGLEPVLAHYAPYSVVPQLSVPSFRLLQRRAGGRRGIAYDARESHAIGAWLPELEFTHYAANSYWRQVMDSCDAFVAVSGNALAATPFWRTGRPYLAWVATDWQGDREDRVRHFPLLRRLLDTCVNAPVIRRLEKKLLAGGSVLSLSQHTARVLGGLAGPQFRTSILPVPIRSDLFVPRPDAVVPGRLGFAGRFRDPRKNIGLLLQTIARLRAQGHEATGLLMGDAPDARILRDVQALGLDGHVRFLPDLSHDQMREQLQTLDIFVVPSHQEGLCIAALEAMACGVPVVSTRCGGPEEFVIPGETGCLADASPQAMAEAAGALLADRALRGRMGLAARRLVESRYATAAVDADFAHAFGSVFPGLSTEEAAVPHV
ncbi:asparagine synthase (glutamine-hydrolyzing) [Caenimonas aquaedulcis]|uniref:asparagine synthase (glutamine-hydrolyzing) n=1 Tax=Caenimonas aquaedulcis TaxID=2793270 RepID=A0A931MIB6_9BURK|nr:asparagine synthase (glutamine-hydrolyzing) [Caenimonas aquaedulcis]MBG9389075.1 asparagine synthase (glutamine-hydrolyzing) [Caenimonas aquaedulcis]